MNMVEVKHLKKYFKTPKGMLHAVDDVSFVVPQGVTLGVVGESGCGKSTLGRTLIQLQAPTDGKILFEGNDVSRLKGKELKEYRKNVQMIFQDPYSSLNPRLSVCEIIAEPFVNYGIYKDKSQLWKRVFELMDTVGLSRRLANSYPHELDGGRRQRIGIARALALNPKFVVCDEPVSALDVSIQAQILNLMQDLQEELGLTYLFITHNMSVVKHVSNHIMVMYLGVVVEYAPADELFEYRLHPYTRALLEAVPIPRLGARKDRSLLTGEISSPIEPKPGCRFAGRCAYAKENCFTESPKLNECRPGHMVSCHYAKEINQLS